MDDIPSECRVVPFGNLRIKGHLHLPEAYHERQIQIDIAVNSGKPKEIAEKMVEGRMKKFTGEVSLTGQPFVMDPSVSVGDFLKSVNTSVSNFIRLEVGEGIEKKEEDFAAEVAKITGGNA